MTLFFSESSQDLTVFLDGEPLESDCISIISIQGTSMYAVLYAYSMLDTIKRSSLPSSEIQK